MRKAWAFFLMLPLVLGGFEKALYAQEEDSPIVSDWDIYAPEFYTRGDQTFVISLGIIFPTVFFDNDGKIKDHNFSPPIGGTGSLAYNYFINSHVSVGGEIGGMLNYTAAQNILYIIPIGLRVGYQFVYRRFEFPLTLTVGIAPRKYVSLDYLGLFVRGGVSVYYRFNADWSFGVNANWYWLPEWTREAKKNMYGNIAEVTLAARYHF